MSYTLRDLPLPVKVVASVFLMAVGVGYSSAMIQLHIQDSKSGKPMPTVDDVIRKYTGKVKFDPQNPPPTPVCRLESLVMGPDNIAICGQTMSPAFTMEDRARGEKKYVNLIKGKTAEQIEAIKAERRGEQVVFQLWIQTPDDQRKAAYMADRFEVPADKMPKALTADFKDGNAVKIKSIIDNRCATCHSKGDEKEDIPLDNYEGLVKFMNVSQPAVSNGYVKIEEPISTAKLTQSTHAHLLSWAVLFSLTGLVFAFSSYPASVRCILGPWVVIAVFADVSLWWSARLCDQWGPYFAMGIIGTGAAAGLGLAAQIVLSLFNMYGIKGKIVLAVLFLLGGGIAGLVVMNQIKPALDAKAHAKTPKEPPKETPKPPKDNPGKGNNSGNNSTKNGNNPGNGGVDKKPYRPVNMLDQLLTLPRLDEKGNPIPDNQMQFNGQDKGTMAPAFFDRDKSKVYQTKMDDAAVPQAEKDKLKAQRQAELDAVLAWIRSPDAARKAAYEADAFDAASQLSKITPEFAQAGKVKIKSIIDNRCAVCHAPEQKQEEYPLTNYDELMNYLKPFPAPKAVDPPAPAAPMPGATTPTTAAEPIPDAKDD